MRQISFGLTPSKADLRYGLPNMLFIEVQMNVKCNYISFGTMWGLTLGNTIQVMASTPTRSQTPFQGIRKKNDSSQHVVMYKYLLYLTFPELFVFVA